MRWVRELPIVNTLRCDAAAMKIEMIAFGPERTLAIGFATHVEIWADVDVGERRSYDVATCVGWRDDGVFLGVPRGAEVLEIVDVCTGKELGGFMNGEEVLVSPDGRWLAVSSLGEGARREYGVFDSRTQECVARHAPVSDGHHELLAVSRDANELVVASSRAGGAVHLLPMRRVGRHRVLETEARTYACAFFPSGDGLVHLGERAISIYRATGSDFGEPMLLDSAESLVLAVHPSGCVLAVFGYGDIELWRFGEAGVRRIAHARNAASSPVNHLAFSASGSRLACTHANGVVAIVDTSSLSGVADANEREPWRRPVKPTSPLPPVVAVPRPGDAPAPFVPTEVPPVSREVWKPTRTVPPPSREALEVALVEARRVIVQKHASGMRTVWEPPSSIVESAPSPTGDRIALMLGDGSLVVVGANGNAQSLVSKIAGGVVWSPDGTLLAMMTYGGPIALDAATGVRKPMVIGDREASPSEWYDDGLLLTSLDGDAFDMVREVLYWRWRGGVHVEELAVAPELPERPRVDTPARPPREEKLVRVLRRWDGRPLRDPIEIGELLQDIPRARVMKEPATLCWSPDGATVVRRSQHYLVILDRHARGERLIVAADPIHAISFSPDGLSIALVTSDYEDGGLGTRYEPRGSVAVHQLVDGAQVAARIEDFEIRSVAFDASGCRVVYDGHTLALAGDDPAGPHVPMPAPIEAMEVTSRDGTRVARIDQGLVRIGDRAQVRPLGTIERVMFSPDGTRVMFGDDRQTCVWELDARREVLRHDAIALGWGSDGAPLGWTKNAIVHLGAGTLLDARSDIPPVIAGDSSAVAIAGKRALRVFSLATLDPIGEIAGHWKRVDALGPGGRAVALGGGGWIDCMTLGQTTTARKLWDASGGMFPPHAATFAASAPVLAGIGGNNDVDVYNDDRQYLCRFSVHEDLAKMVALSPDGKRIAIATGHAVFIADVNSGAVELWASESATALAFSRDGARLACGTEEGTVRIYPL